MAAATTDTTTTLVRFSRFLLASRDAQLSVTVTATAELAWWPAGSEVLLGGHVPVARVVQLVRAGRLWIGCDGRAFGLTVHPTLEGRDLLPPPPPPPPPLVEGSASVDLADRFSSAVLDWRSWENELGLCVRRSTMEPRDMPFAPQPSQSDEDDDHAAAVAAVHFLVKHPPSTNGLYAPSTSGIPQAQFRRVVCRLNFRFHPEGLPLAAVAVPPAAKARRPKKSSKTERATAPKTSKPKPKRERRMPVLQQLPRSELFRNRDMWLKVTALVEASLHALVGVKRRTVGVRSIGSATVPSLIDMAPAVWNYNYFQSVACRAAFVPSICKLLSGFAAAQSPGLRRKVSAMSSGQGHYQTSGPASESEIPSALAESISTRIQEILLKYVPPLPRRAKPRSTATLGKPARSCVNNECQESQLGGYREQTFLPETSFATLRPDTTTLFVQEGLYLMDMGDEVFCDISFDDLDEALPSSAEQSEGDFDEQRDWEEVKGSLELEEWLGDSSCSSGRNDTLSPRAAMWYEEEDCNLCEEVAWEEIDRTRLEDWLTSESQQRLYTQYVENVEG